MKDLKNARLRRPARNLVLTAALLCLAASGAALNASAQSLGSFDRDSAEAMLSAVKNDLKKNYYAPSLRGMDVEARFRAAEEKIKQAQSRDALVVTVAQVLLDLNDSHTFLLPPPRAARVEYGWQMKMFGDDCFVSAVKPKSDAEAKGLKVGDRILSVDGFRPARANMWKMYYRYYALMPSRTIRLSVQSPGDAEPRELAVDAKIEKGQAVAQWENIFVRALREEWDLDHDRFFEPGIDETGVGNVLYFGASVTVADVIMPDGKSLENAGVTSDEVVTPTGADLAAHRDPALARAAELSGVKLEPEKAGTLFPVEWRK